MNGQALGTNWGPPPDPSKWPAGVVQLEIQDLGYLGRDAEGALYWDGTKIEVVKRLGRFERWLAGLAVALGLLASMGSCSSGIKDAVELVCGGSWSSCTEAPVAGQAVQTPAPTLDNPG
jgi:hypothetical protein